ncbi:hypothetical protein C8Q77DRAFT_1137485 [Trametes polyzona]|nr:hypothetical protein C8Q77DRAFT_1137485 [Trametes polyzona]
MPASMVTGICAVCATAVHVGSRGRRVVPADLCARLRMAPRRASTEARSMVGIGSYVPCAPEAGAGLNASFRKATNAPTRPHRTSRDGDPGEPGHPLSPRVCQLTQRKTHPPVPGEHRAGYPVLPAPFFACPPLVSANSSSAHPRPRRPPTQTHLYDQLDPAASNPKPHSGATAATGTLIRMSPVASPPRTLFRFSNSAVYPVCRVPMSIVHQAYDPPSGRTNEIRPYSLT